MTALTVEERLARLEARVAELERAPGPGDARPPAPQPRSEAEVAAVWERLGGGRSPAGPTPLQRMVLADGLYDPTVPLARAEVERMREE